MTIWTVSPHYKKSVQEIEHWVRRQGEGRITTINGYRGAEWTVETDDGKPPVFEFTRIPEGDGRKDSINMLDCDYNNIVNVELVEMFDGGCWFETEFEDLTLEEEEELELFLEENSIFELEEREDSWYNQETEWWIWGPIEIRDEDDNIVRIIIADENGNVIDFKEL